MNKAMNRRIAVKSLAGCFAGGVLASEVAASGWMGPTAGIAANSVERAPIGDRKSPKFKLSLAAYSYRDLLTAKANKTPEMDLHGFIEECAEMQLEGTELTGYYMPESPTRDYLQGLRTHCFRSGLSVSGTAIRCDFGLAESNPNRQKEIDHVRRWIDYAEILQAPTIRIFAGHPEKGLEPDQAHRLMVDGMRRVSDYAGEKGIYLGLEDHGGPTETAEGLLRLLHDANHPWLGVNLDTGNFRGKVDPYEQMAMVAPFAVNVQVKATLPMPDGSKQPMDYAVVANILRKSNYRGYVVLEFEDPGDVRVECRKHIELLRKVFQA